jgi:hypothetical protein
MTSAMEKGPYLVVAVFCDMTLIGQDSTLSIIRIVDAVTQTVAVPDPPDVMPAFLLTTKLVVMLKAGEARGRYTVRIRPEAPDGRELPSVDQVIQLEGGYTGANLLIDVNLAVDLEGVYWFDVFFVAAPGEERLLTRVPLRVLYQPQKIGGPA